MEKDYFLICLDFQIRSYKGGIFSEEPLRMYIFPQGSCGVQEIRIATVECYRKTLKAIGKVWLD